MNCWNGIGRLTKDVELRYGGAENTPFANFTVALSRSFKKEGQPEADFIPVVAIGKNAEFCSKYFSKGQQVGVTGRIQTRTWEDTEGNKRYATEVVADKVYFADSKKESNDTASDFNVNQEDDNLLF
jgi:single-strand DNA-binding protein